MDKSYEAMKEEHAYLTERLKEAVDDRNYINDRCRKAEELLKKAEEDIQRLEASLKQANLDRAALRDEMADMADELETKTGENEIRVLLPEGTKLSSFRFHAEVAE